VARGATAAIGGWVNGANDPTYSRTSRDFECTTFHLRLRLIALQKVEDEFVESIPVLDHEPMPALPEDVHLHV
jgi:hypothetical protein